MWKKILGYSIIGLLFASLFWVVSLSMGFITTLVIFSFSLGLTGIVVLAAYLIA